MLRTTLVALLLVGMVVAGPAIRTNRSENETSSVAPPENEVVTEVTAGAVEPEVTAGADASSSTTEVPTTTAAAATTKPRKTITFDQRQQGKFNIRADLENFVIVVVPSSPSAGISLLDLLNRSGQKGAKKKSAHRKGVKHHGAQKKAHHTTTPEVVVLDESHARVDNEEFIEGRTPYRVDISARSNDVPTADMPSPIYRVMRPLNYEQPAVASNMIRFPSASSSSSGNYYDDGDGSTVERQAKALAPGVERFDEIRTNTVYAILTNGDGMIAEADQDDDDDHEDNYLTYAQDRTYYDLPTPFHPASSFDSLGEDAQYPRSDVDMGKLQLQQQGDDYSTLKLLGAQEQCGPDRKRDSYGVCQFVAP
uniref:Putative conserved secreted protein n=1 Tax=Culex tarsalis TaxID=7177 RepID=A0A1Q3FRA3_CULTA